MSSFGIENIVENVYGFPVAVDFLFGKCISPCTVALKNIVSKYCGATFVIVLVGLLNIAQMSDSL